MVSETAIVANFRTLQQGQVDYNGDHATFAGNNGQLAPYVGGILGCTAAPCPSGGYGYTVLGDPPSGDVISGYLITAIPTVPGSGVRSFCATESSGLRVDGSGGTIDSKAACLALPAP